jgi:hypothetical protein
VYKKLRASARTKTKKMMIIDAPAELVGLFTINPNMIVIAITKRVIRNIITL